MPAAWTLQDRSEPGSIVVSFIEPLGRAMVGVEQFTASAQADEVALKRTLGLHPVKTYGDAVNLDPEEIAFNNGVASVTFAFDSQLQGKPTRMIGAIFLAQYGNRVSILRSMAPAADAQRLYEPMNKIGLTYKPNVAAKI